MKSILKTSLVAIILIAFSCSKEDDTPVTEQNNAPTINAQTFTAPENIADNIAIGVVEASDLDGDTLVFSISTNDENLFEINDNGLLSLDDLKTLDFETKQSHNITVSVTDGSTTIEATVTINVTDIDDTSFVTTWQTTSSNETVTILTRATEFTYHYTIDWGDGTTQVDRTDDASHTYTTAGIYTINISGTFLAIVLNDSNILQDQLRTVEQWGNIQWRTMFNAFSRVNTLTMNATDIPDLSQVTNTELMFAFINNLSVSGDFSSWDVSNVTNMGSMFKNSSFNQDISAWDVSNVTNMEGMFFDSQFNQNIGSWEVTNVINMEGMFAFSPFNHDISGWDVSNVTNMKGMFGFEALFNQDISAWNVSNVTDMGFMFRNSTFNQDISAWEVTNVVNMIKMFQDSSFNQDISNWNVANVTNCSDFSLNAPLTTANTPNFTNCTP